MIDDTYSCEGQMNFEECLREMDAYKWQTGQYMNLPETGDFESDEDNGLHSKGKRKRNIKGKSLHCNGLE